MAKVTLRYKDGTAAVFRSADDALLQAAHDEEVNDSPVQDIVKGVHTTRGENPQRNIEAEDKNVLLGRDDIDAAIRDRRAVQATYIDARDEAARIGALEGLTD